MSVVGHEIVSDTIGFADFRLDRAEGMFRRDASDESTPIAIGSRALQLLWTLASRPGQLLSKRELMDAVWPDTTVEEKNLAVQISTLRQVLEREGGKGAWIQTVPSRGYRFAAPPPQAPGASQEPGDAPSISPRRRNGAVLGAVAVLLAVIGLALTGGRMRADPKPLLAYSPQDRRQSIAVLPFENGSGDSAQDRVAATVTREVTAMFDRDQSVPSIPAVIAAAYRGKTIDLRLLGREQDVHFVLLGHSHQQDGSLMVSATLYETAHGNQIWGLGFALADGVEAGAGTVASLIHQQVDQATMDEEVRIAQRDHAGQLDKRDLMFAAYTSDLSSQLSKPGIQAQIALIDRALALDPDYVWALRAKGRRHADLVLQGFSDDPAQDIAIATEAADRALQLSPNNASTLKEKTYVLRARGNWPEAEALTRKLLAARPRVSARHANLARASSWPRVDTQKRWTLS